MDLGFCRSYWLATFAPCENPLYGQNTSRTPGYVPEVCSRLALELQRAPTAFRTRGRWSVASQPRKLLPFATVEQPTGSRSLESLQKTRYATSRNPRNGAAILSVPRLNLLCSQKSRREQHLRTCHFVIDIGGALRRRGLLRQIAFKALPQPIDYSRFCLLT